jgi:hypothetical protein
MTTLRRPAFDAIEDQPTREALQGIYDFLVLTPLLLGGYEHFVVTTLKAETNLKLPHSLGFQPKDIIQTALSGGTVTFHYDQFTTSYIVLSTSAPITVRFFGGTNGSENS